MPLYPAAEQLAPCYAQLSGCRATAASERMLLHCTSTSFPLRGATNGPWTNEAEEIPVEDQAAPDFEECFEQAVTGGEDDLMDIHGDPSDCSFLARGHVLHQLRSIHEFSTQFFVRLSTLVL